MRPIYTGSFLAIALTGYGAVAQGQENCQNQVDELRDRLDNQELSSDLEQSIRELLDQAEGSDNCAQLVVSAERALEVRQQDTQQAANQPPQQGQQAAAQDRQPGAPGQLESAQGPQQQAAPEAQPDAGQQQAARSAQRQRDQGEQQAAAGEAQQGNRTQIEIEQPAANVNVEAPPAQIEVQQQPAQVEVRQQPLNVEITQAEPEVTVNQPEPEVTVNQPEPEVTVNQAEPEVEVSQPEPQVQVSQAEPEVEVSQAEPEVTFQQQDREQDQDLQARAGEQDQAELPQEAQQPQEAQPTRAATISEQEAIELVGETVESRTGEEIGEVANIVQSEADGNYYAVVEFGGVLGLGEETKAVPFEELEFDPDRNLVSLMSRQEIEQLPEYDEARYRELGAEASAAVGQAGQPALQGDPATTFAQADRNADGELSRSEAARIDGLEFARADQNDDGAISRAEHQAVQ